MNAQGETTAAAAMTTVRQFVDRVCWRARVEDVAAGAAAFVCGTSGAAVGWSLAFGGAGILGALVLAAGCAVAFLGARLLVRAALWPPSRSRVAAWIESAIPELRDALATAIEAGHLAESSAEYAAPRIADARPGALLPSKVRRQRVALVVTAVAVLLAISVVASVAKPEVRVESGVRSSASVAPEASDTVGEGDAEDLRGIVTGEVAPAAQPESRMTLRAVAVPRYDASEAGAVDATAILVGSPQGFERAVELFVTREEAKRQKRDSRSRDDTPAP